MESFCPPSGEDPKCKGTENIPAKEGSKLSEEKVLRCRQKGLQRRQIYWMSMQRKRKHSCRLSSKMQIAPLLGSERSLNGPAKLSRE